MKKVSLSGSPRANVGKKDASALRKEGRVPCVVYGGKEQTAFHVSEIELKKIVWSPNVYQVEISLEGKTIPAIIKDIQFHPVTDSVSHVDFLEILPGKDVKVNLPLRLNGIPEGVKKGGKLYQNFRKLAVAGAVDVIPETIELNVEGLNIGDNIRVREIALKGVKLLELPDAVVASVKVTRNVEEPVATTAAATPAATAAPAADAKAATPDAKAAEKKK